jgi:hypothetical protein
VKCTICGKPITILPRNRKTCGAGCSEELAKRHNDAARKRWAEANPEAVKASKEDWRHRNPEAVKAHGARTKKRIGKTEMRKRWREYSARSYAKKLEGR